MQELKRILLVEDSANDVELILAALAESSLANEVVVVRDGEEALDYLYRRGVFRLRMEAAPVVGLFWAVVNQPPPGSTCALRNS
ncbi:MAG: hypothetical protein M3O33_22100 [Cyanobacteriota bacterium]|nr:hypothetical protein [Cyanobacteriota bacterium]